MRRGLHISQYLKPLVNTRYAFNTHFNGIIALIEIMVLYAAMLL